MGIVQYLSGCKIPTDFLRHSLFWDHGGDSPKGHETAVGSGVEPTEPSEQRQEPLGLMYVGGYTNPTPGDSSRDLCIPQLEVTNILWFRVTYPSQKGHQENCQAYGYWDFWNYVLWKWKSVPSRKLRAHPWKCHDGWKTSVSFWNGPFSGIELFIFRGVVIYPNGIWRTLKLLIFTMDETAHKSSYGGCYLDDHSR